MQSTPEKYPNNSKFAGLLIHKEKKESNLDYCQHCHVEARNDRRLQHLGFSSGVGGTFK